MGNMIRYLAVATLVFATASSQARNPKQVTIDQIKDDPRLAKKVVVVRACLLVPLGPDQGSSNQFLLYKCGTPLNEALHDNSIVAELASRDAVQPIFDAGIELNNEDEVRAEFIGKIHRKALDADGTVYSILEVSSIKNPVSLKP